MTARVWGIYLTDAGDPWAQLVDPTYYSDAARGWTAATPGVDVPIPRGWQTRKVWGYSSSGSRILATVATLEAPLWTGAQSTFQVLLIDGTSDIVTVVGQLAERLKPTP